MSDTRPRILCVDDEPHVLDGLIRVLRRDFDVVPAVGSHAGLEVLRNDRTFAVIVSDLRMPGLDGISLLTEASRIVPDASRILLTGYADVRSATRAVNEGRVLQLLTKPCAPDVLKRVLDLGVGQYRLVTAQRDLLERTLRGSVQMLIELLALSQPAAFGRASRVRKLMGEVATMIGFRDGWQLEMAAMLSQIGVLALPPALAVRYSDGSELTPEEEHLVGGLPGVAADLLKDIPRLDEIREVLTSVNLRFVRADLTQAVDGTAIPLGARLLRVVLDYDRLCSRGYSSAESVARLVARNGLYDPDILSDFATVVGAQDHRVVRELRLQDVEIGMEFVDDVRAADGTLLVARGQEATPHLLERIRDYWSDLHLPSPVRVTFPSSPAQVVTPPGS
jgi:response regulator RpfG family c-di-GMP phosphodiesterase